MIEGFTSISGFWGWGELDLFILKVVTILMNRGFRVGLFRVIG